MKLPKITIQHLFGSILMGTILISTVITENVERFPSIASKLPMRCVITTKQETNLYSIEYEGNNKKPIGVLKSGETVDFEAWMCPYKEIKLSNGNRYLILAEKDEIEIKLLKFYYF